MIRLLYPTLLFCITLLLSCSRPIGFEYRSIRDISLEKLNGQNSVISMNLVYYNPNNFGVNLKHVNCNISADGIYIGNFKLDTLIHINKKSEFILPTRLQVSMSNILQVSARLLFKEVTISARGQTRVGKGGIYVNLPIEYSGKQKLNLF